MLNATDLEVYIGTAPIIRKGSFTIRSGTMTGLFGRNGAGKTTLLRAIMGLARIGAGSIQFENRADLRTIPIYERARIGIGYMPEDRRLIPSITAEENIVLPLWATQIPDAKQRLEWIYSVVPECLPLRDRRASLLSGGQQKLVALARALMVGRRLLLLDEPTEGVAPALAHRIVEILRLLARERCTVFVAESDVKKLDSLEGHAYLIERGRIVGAESGRQP
jgi:branched-chain amino acid transport system ATP-binding protein